MKLRGIEFGTALGAAGVQGFYGEGYAYHRLLGPLAPKFEGMTFVSKTTTIDYNPGNMPLRGDLQPQELRPKCIWVNPPPFQAIALNSVGLSGPGTIALLEGRDYYGSARKDKWQHRTEPFLISFMPIKSTKEDRLKETKRFVSLLCEYLHTFRTNVGVQFNLTCPNVGLDTEKLVEESNEHLDILADLRIPIMEKLNLLVPPLAVVQISEHPACDAICSTNAIPFGKWDKVDWIKLFPKGSPLAKFGGGGLSGQVLFAHLLQWVTEVMHCGLKKPLNAGGGIMQWYDVDTLKEAGLRPGIDSIFIGTVAMLRPWRVKNIISQADHVLGTCPY